MGLALTVARQGSALPNDEPPGQVTQAPRHVSLGLVTTPEPVSPAQRWVWEHRFGRMCIEVREGEVYVDGQRVEPHRG